MLSVEGGIVSTIEQSGMCAIRWDDFGFVKPHPFRNRNSLVDGVSIGRTALCVKAETFQRVEVLGALTARSFFAGLDEVKKRACL